jgi:hypothetical protein
MPIWLIKLKRKMIYDVYNSNKGGVGRGIESQPEK